MTEMPDPALVPEWTLGWRLQRSLAHAGLTVNEMAKALGVSRQTLGRWMSDRVAPRSIYVKEWALRTNVDYGWLVTGKTGPDRPVLPGQRDVRYRGIRRHVNRIRPLTGLVAA
jgi:transcriptional regulator with XRE-family HTH domain